MSSEHSSGAARHPRPLSPHLQVYSWQITMTMSILHRATGVVLSIGAVGVIVWLLALATGGEFYADVTACLSSWVGLAAMVGWSFALFYHLCNGIRHLAWDAGKGYSMKGLYTGGYIAIGLAVLLTVGFWLWVLGGAA